MEQKVLATLSYVETLELSGYDVQYVRVLGRDAQHEQKTKCIDVSRRKDGGTLYNEDEKVLYNVNNSLPLEYRGELVPYAQLVEYRVPVLTAQEVENVVKRLLRDLRHKRLDVEEMTVDVRNTIDFMRYREPPTNISGFIALTRGLPTNPMNVDTEYGLMSVCSSRAQYWNEQERSMVHGYIIMANDPNDGRCRKGTVL